MRRKSFSTYIMLAAMTGMIFMGSVQADDKAAPSAEVKVAILNYKFDPEVVTVSVGTTVTWINHDEVPHTVVSSDKRFTGSGGLDTDDHYSYVFTKPGTYEYFCTLHPFMKGKIVVTEAKTAP